MTEWFDSWQEEEDTDETSEMEIEEAENPVPHIDENPVPNIDEGDEGNPLAVSEYIEDMFRFYCETQVILSSFESTTYVDVSPFWLPGSWYSLYWISISESSLLVILPCFVHIQNF